MTVDPQSLSDALAYRIDLGRAVWAHLRAVTLERKSCDFRPLNPLRVRLEFPASQAANSGGDFSSLLWLFRSLILCDMAGRDVISRKPNLQFKKPFSATFCKILIL